MTWNGIEALECNSIIPSNSATEQVYAYLLTRVYMCKPQFKSQVCN